ncbi:gas vesicle protein GvpO [Pseudonocardia sp.]|uniref:gas vesicle protein GvpO n=1 Tax=Pseudonocardia sp. TaxID=60912 RepID=UPI003D11DB8F
MTREEAAGDTGARRGRGASRPPERRHNGRLPTAEAARAAAAAVSELTGRRSETVVSVDRHESGWKVGVEVVESSRIPDTNDILALYVVVLDADGELVSYRRTRRYVRGRIAQEGR